MKTSSTALPSPTESFHRNGYYSPINILPPDEAAHYRAEVEHIFQHFQPPTNVFRQIHLHIPWAFDLLHRKEILEPVCAILGEDVLVRGVMVLVKPPHSSGVVLWHSDHAYTLKGTSPQLSAWLALSPSFPENGCMKVVAGSQREIHPHRQVSDGSHQLNQNLTILHEPEPSSIVNLQLEPGQMSLHDPMILHGSDANQTDIPRIGFIIRYTTPDFAADQVPTIRVSGQKPCPHLNIVNPVFADDRAEQIDRLLQFNQQYKVHGHN